MIKLNYFHTIRSKELKKGLTLTSLSNKKENVFKKTIINKSRPMMDWVTLPYQSTKDVEEIELFGKKISRIYENFIVLGIGGSALGANAVKQALYQDGEGKIKIDIVDNVDAERFENLIANIDYKRTMFNIVTKSGKTVEILSMFAVVTNKLKAVMGKDFFINIVVTTERDNILWQFCEKNNIKTYEVPKGVGGRYSVLSPVGLLPMAVMGLDLKKVLNGAKQVLENFKQQPANKSLCFTSATIMYNHFLQGKREFVILPYSERLNSMADFYIQLLSESLGKTYLLNGKPNNMFFTPTKAVGVTYQHSLLQMYQEGASDRLFFFLNLTKHNQDTKIPKFKDANLDALLPKTLTTLFKAEQNASSLALKQAGHPSFEVNVPTLTEENIGALLYYFELTTALLGEYMGVNSYDQNGVELQKKYTKAIIGVEGFEKEQQTLLKMLENKEKYEI